MVRIFHFLPTSLVFEIVNPFSWILNAISSEKSCLITDLLTLHHALVVQRLDNAIHRINRYPAVKF